MAPKVNKAQNCDGLSVLALSAKITTANDEDMMCDFMARIIQGVIKYSDDVHLPPPSESTSARMRGGQTPFTQEAAIERRTDGERRDAARASDIIEKVGKTRAWARAPLRSGARRMGDHSEDLAVRAAR